MQAVTAACAWPVKLTRAFGKTRDEIAPVRVPLEIGIAEISPDSRGYRFAENWGERRSAAVTGAGMLAAAVADPPSFPRRSPIRIQAERVGYSYVSTSSG